jgi:serine/threonine protein phosphatase PrpC
MRSTMRSPAPPSSIPLNLPTSRAAYKVSSDAMTEFAALTHPGNRAGENQDSIGWDAERKLWLVADGMGGHASGEVASRLVKETLLAQAPLVGVPAAVLLAHAAVCQESQNIDPQRGMGSTVVTAQIADRTAQIVWVGDSRAYLWRRGQLQRLTRDHSYLEMLRQEENLTETALRNQQGSNVVTQALGMGTPAPSQTSVPLRHGDWIILCSDGVPVELRDSEIAQALAAHSVPKDAADALLAATMAHGGRDNISIIVIPYDGASAWGTRSLVAKFKGHVFEWSAVLAGMILAVAIALIWEKWTK